MFNIEKWHSTRKEVEASIKTLKYDIRSTWCPTGQQYGELHRLQDHATALYCIRAALRGRTHLPGMTREDAVARFTPYAQEDAPSV